MANIYQKPILAFIILFQVIHLTLSGCITAPKTIGLENNIILDSQISASGEWVEWDGAVLAAKYARLNHPRAWCTLVSDVNQWLQVDLKNDGATLFNISTQGRSATFNQYVMSYTISHSNDGTNFQDYTENSTPKTFQGNYDGDTIVTNYFTPPIEARYIRINPKTWNSHISMRIELFGCYHENNLAANQQGLSNTASDNNQLPRYLTDLNRLACFVSQRTNQLKWVGVRLISTVMISKIFIANNPKYMNELFDFDIKVGSCSVKTVSGDCCIFPFEYYNKQYYSCKLGDGGRWCALTENYEEDKWGYCKEEDHSSSSYCLPGLQDMRGIETASFFCEPRVSGDHVLIKQHRADKVLSICQIAVYEEAEATIVNWKKDRYTWKAINEDLTLTCDAKGYPAPVVTWVKDGAAIESSSSTLEIKSLLNSSGKYGCLANNTHGVDFKYFHLVVASHLRICVDNVELKHDIGKEFGWQLKGSEWYHLYDAKRRRFLQFFEKAPTSDSNCQIWLNGGHPTLQDGVVSRTLCVVNTSHDCSATIDVHIRTCAYYYIYNIKYSQYLIGKKYCFMNGRNDPGGVKPMIMASVTNHALSQKVLHIETEVLESYKCLGMCHIEPRCKSVNFSKKLKLCELNTATKKEFPGNYGPSKNYDYYVMGKGMTIAVKGEL